MQPHKVNLSMLVDSQAASEVVSEDRLQMLQPVHRHLIKAAVSGTQDSREELLMLPQAHNHSAVKRSSRQQRNYSLIPLMYLAVSEIFSLHRREIVKSNVFRINFFLDHSIAQFLLHQNKQIPRNFHN